MDDLAPVMSQLPDPDPPATLAATVMARIHREADEQAAFPAVVVSRRDIASWWWTLAGVALVFGAAIYGWYATGATPDIVSSRIGPGRPALIPTAGPGGMVLALGLLCYLAGLFAPLRLNRSTTVHSRNSGGSTIAE